VHEHDADGCLFLMNHEIMRSTREPVCKSQCNAGGCFATRDAPSSARIAAPYYTIINELNINPLWLVISNRPR